MSQSKEPDVQCPSCNRSFSPQFINFHLDSCLYKEPETKRQKKTASKIDIFFNKGDKSSEQKTKQEPAILASKSIKDENKPKTNNFAPLAETLRPNTLDQYEGQLDVVGDGSMLKTLITCNNIPSMIFWGPPGCGKTTLAHIIANNCKFNQNSRFVKLSATASRVKDVKDMIEIAKNEQKMFKKRTVLFIDEIHRFNKLQQDVFLPHVENGTIILIGATTENPSFSLNNALLSRCRVIVLKQLEIRHITNILMRALQTLDITIEGSPEEKDNPKTIIEKEAIEMIAGYSDGDARFAINCLQLTVESLTAQNSTQCIKINKKDVEDGLQRMHTLYDRQGDHHYDTISAFIKSMRGSDENAALYYLGRMLAGGEDPRFIARRLMVFASEDVGLADSSALNLAVSTSYCCQNVGMPECRINLAHCVAYMAKAPKSRESYEAFANVENLINLQKGPHPPVPLHLRNAPTKLMKNLDYSKGYKMYDAELPFLPESIKDVNFFN